MIPILIDCDPGIDDAVALMLALSANDKLDVLGVTTVFGNVDVEQNTVNALKILELCGAASVPVAKGSSRPILVPIRNAHFIHGTTGLGNLLLPSPRRRSEDIHGVDFMLQKIASSGEAITLVALGPLTNVALAIVKAPEIMARLEKIVLMCGAVRELGNMPNASGFNAYADPHAAEIVFRSGLPIVQCTTDATHHVRITPPQIAAIRDVGGRWADVVAHLFEPHIFDPHEAAISGADDPVGGCMHDVCCIAYLLEPDLFRGRMANVQVEISSELGMGRTIIDWWGRSLNPKNVLVLNHVDGTKFFELLRRHALAQKH